MGTAKRFVIKWSLIFVDHNCRTLYTCILNNHVTFLVVKRKPNLHNSKSCCLCAKTRFACVSCSESNR